MRPQTHDGSRLGRPPVTPDFPIYGLAHSFTGSRWLELWNMLLGLRSTPGNRLWHVDLGHGDSALNDPFVIVSTHAKLPAVEGERGPTSIVDAALRAQVIMIDAAGRNDQTEGRGARARAQVNSADELAHDLNAPEWDRMTAVVDGAPTSFRRRCLDDVWAAVAGFETVAVGVCGRGLKLDDHALETIDDLARYPRL